MRRLATVTALLLVTALPAVAQQQQGTAGPTNNAAAVIAQATMDGQSTATNVGTGGWFGGSMVGGVFTGLIGTAVSYALAASSNVELPAQNRAQIATQQSDYQINFEKAYADKVRSKRKGAALKGGLVGTAAFVALVLASSSGG